MRLHRAGEDEFTERLARRLRTADTRIVAGIGDDASVTRIGRGRVELVTTDVMIEGTHYEARYTPPRLLGRKSLAISLSDIAAMGGTPIYCLVSLALPRKTPRPFLDELYMGLAALARRFGVSITGGNTSGTTGPLMVSTTVIGEMEEARVARRNGARAGEAIYVTGTLGDAALGLAQLKRRGKATLEGDYKSAVRAHLDPTPRLRAGRELAVKKIPGAMTDISDGLILDLSRLARASGVDALVELDLLPLSAAMKRYKKRSKTWRELALSGGEDYELLFTAPSKAEEQIAALAKRLRLRITRIGETTKRTGRDPEVRILDGKGGEIRLKKPGFVHF